MHVNTKIAACLPVLYTWVSVLFHCGLYCNVTQKQVLCTKLDSPTNKSVYPVQQCILLDKFNGSLLQVMLTDALQLHCAIILQECAPTRIKLYFLNHGTLLHATKNFHFCQYIIHTPKNYQYFVNQAIIQQCSKSKSSIEPRFRLRGAHFCRKQTTKLALNYFVKMWSTISSWNLFILGNTWSWRECFRIAEYC